MSIEHAHGSTEHLGQVAGEVLPKLGAIADAARRALSLERGSSIDALINPSLNAVRELDKIQHSLQLSYRSLMSEPAIARVVAMTEDGEKRIYYICRSTPVLGVENLASYRAPVGRLAALEVGGELALPTGGFLEVLERAQLKPRLTSDGWDSIRSVLEAEGFGPLTIESLLELLRSIEGQHLGNDRVGKVLEEESLKSNIIEGVRRNVISKMGLRDQPILDQYQDEVFRLPLDTRLVLLGPPGTGKTTTLIRRLGQKLDIDFLDEDERRAVKSISDTQGVIHADSWLMFTPTELLKQYVKEAFAREGIPASDLRIRTWSDYRRELGKNVFGVLKSATGGGTFILKEDIQALNRSAYLEPIDWYEDFDAWQQLTYRQGLHNAARLLSQSPTAKVKDLGESLTLILGRSGTPTMASIFTALEPEAEKVRSVVSSLKDSSDSSIRKALNHLLNQDERFLDSLASVIDDFLQIQAADTAEPDELDDDEVEEDEDEPIARTEKAKAITAFSRAVRAQARAVASRRSISKTSRNGRIIEWLNKRSLVMPDQLQVGLNLLTLTQARRFLSPLKRYVDGMPRRYRAFRRLRSEEGTWYATAGLRATDIHPLELDGVLLAILRAGSELLNRPHVNREIDGPIWSYLKAIRDLYKDQILADEATDFSPLQLACMGALTQPKLRSFFACGDFNQRLTTWGTRSVEELKWVFPDLDIKEVRVAYRQSKQLNDLAKAIIQVISGTEQFVSLPEHVDSNGVAPALLEFSKGEAVVGWLADRIREIERFVGQLPSTAIFVNSEEDVSPLAEALSSGLADQNIQVVACHEGRAIGQESNVRVFDVQHIKGLEFEAVIFVGIDQLAKMQPDLFDKYLYVGATRAATYLGITCEGNLPPVMEDLRSLFVNDWQSPGMGQ